MNITLIIILIVNRDPLRIIINSWAAIIINYRQTCYTIVVFSITIIQVNK